MRGGPSLWQSTVTMPTFPPLEGDVKTDVLIIGGGLTGLLCAHRLAEAGVDCLVVEAGRVCGGVTGGTTAKVTSQHGLIYSRLIGTIGVERTSLYLKVNQEAVEKYRVLAEKFPCSFEETDSYVYAMDRPDKLEDELKALDRIGGPGTYAADLPLPFPTAGAVMFPGQGQIHPLALLAGLAGRLNVRENTPVRYFDGARYVTDRGKITAEKTIVATHFPIFNRHGAYFLKLYQQRSYVLALKGAEKVNGMYIGAQENSLSFRSYGDCLLLGGGGHRTGGKGGGWAELTAAAGRYYPKAEETARWAAQDCMPLDSVPYIGRYGRGTPNLYVATGYQKWGMTTAMTAADLLRDLILGKDNPYASLYDPARPNPRPQLTRNVVTSALHLITPTVPRCTHMGCALKWNREEGTWDCPCHGSRFSAKGEILEAPATKPMKSPPTKTSPTQM